jgi:hypothetical protein
MFELVTLKVEGLSVDFCIGSLNEASTLEVVGILAVPEVGFTLTIAGGTLSLFFFLIELRVCNSAFD